MTCRHSAKRPTHCAVYDEPLTRPFIRWIPDGVPLRSMRPGKNGATELINRRPEQTQRTGDGRLAPSAERPSVMPITVADIAVRIEDGRTRSPN